MKEAGIHPVIGPRAVPVELHSAGHGGREHGGTTTTQEPVSPAAPVAPSAEAIRRRIESYVQRQTQTDGTFVIEDQETGATRRLQFIRVHHRVGKSGEFYYSCTDMRDINTGELLDLDFDVLASNGTLEVVDTRIHKVEGKARYTYDKKDHRVPVPLSAR